MRLFKPSADFLFKKFEKRKISDLAIDSHFKLSIPESALLKGDYPRRVSIGEVLFTFTDKTIVLSPVEGIARFLQEEYCISISQDGSWNKNTSYQSSKFTKESLLQKTEQLGLISFDFDNKPFLKLLQAFSGKENSKIIFSPFSGENFIDFKKILFPSLEKEFEEFKENLNSIFPKSKILDFCYNSKLKFKYPQGNPAYFAKTVLNINTLNDTQILFIGPETLFHLLKGIYFDVPFFKRHIAFLFLNRNGKLNSIKMNTILLNGQSLKPFQEKFKKDYKGFTENSLYLKNPFHEIDDQVHIDIYKQSAIIFTKNKPKKSFELPCISCNECNYFCPTSANPSALITDKNNFEASKCIECGICTVFCPSSISLDSRINDLKNQKVPI